MSVITDKNRNNTKKNSQPFGPLKFRGALPDSRVLWPSPMLETILRLFSFLWPSGPSVGDGLTCSFLVLPVTSYVVVHVSSKSSEQPKLSKHFSIFNDNKV